MGGEISVLKPPHRWRVKRGSERDRSWATAAWPFLRKCRSVTIDVFLKNELFKNFYLWIHLLPLTRPILVIRRLALNTQCSKSECESSHHTADHVDSVTTCDPLCPGGSQRGGRAWQVKRRMLQKSHSQWLILTAPEVRMAVAQTVFQSMHLQQTQLIIALMRETPIDFH